MGEAWYGLGDAHRFADDFEPAIAAFQRCVQLDPNYLDGWNNLGITFAETGQFDKAKTAWKALLTRDPKNCKAHNNLGSLAFQQQEWTISQGEFIDASALSRQCDCPLQPRQPVLRSPQNENSPPITIK